MRASDASDELRELESSQQGSPTPQAPPDKQDVYEEHLQGLHTQVDQLQQQLADQAHQQEQLEVGLLA